jgi:hypothetical protein
MYFIIERVKQSLLCTRTHLCPKKFLCWRSLYDTYYPYQMIYEYKLVCQDCNQCIAFFYPSELNEISEVFNIIGTPDYILDKLYSFFNRQRRYRNKYD